MLFAIFYPALKLIDFLIIASEHVTRREAGTSLSFQSTSPETTDWWTFFAVGAGGIVALLVYLSQSLPIEEDWALRMMTSLGAGACVTVILIWFHPRLFFARLTLVLLGPIFLTSLFGAEFTLDANGDYLGGFVRFGAEPDPVTTIVSGLLCALAMIFHGKRS